MKDIVNTLDLTLERRLGATPAIVWRALTEPDLLKKWFAPKPWRVTEIDIDPTPGGRFFLAMRGPNDEPEECATDRDDPGGCVLMAEPERRLVWTDGLSEGFRPKAAGFMTADIRLTPDGNGTHYEVVVRHKDGADRQKHLDMGFDSGWSTVADQLAELVAQL